MLYHQYGMHQSCCRCLFILEHLFSTQMRLCRRDSKYTLYEMKYEKHSSAIYQNHTVDS